MEQTWYNRGEFRSGILAPRRKSAHEITAKSFSIRPLRHPKSGWRTIKACSALFEAIDTRRTPKMPFTHAELEFLSTWANEEKATNPYILPAHQQQAAHRVRGVTLIRAIKAWARSAGRKDEEILELCNNPNPPWPWDSDEELKGKSSAVWAEVSG